MSATITVGDVVAVLDRRLDDLPPGTVLEDVATGATVRVVEIPRADDAAADEVAADMTKRCDCEPGWLGWTSGCPRHDPTPQEETR